MTSIGAAGRGGNGAAPGGRGARIAAGVAAGAAMILYPTVVERAWFALRRVTVPVLSPGAPELRVLHLADLHVLPRHRHKIAWVSALARLQPDLVVNTGDSISGVDAVPAAGAALGDLLCAPGAFVLGNNDFYRPTFKSPHRYFTPRKPIHREPDMPVDELRALQAEHGWAEVNNARTTIDVGGRRVAVAGVNDPHTWRDHYEQIAGPADLDAVVRIGVTHSPEPRVLDAFAADGYDLVLAGHTHGGQVRIPGFGPVVTNAGIDRGRARGLSTWPAPPGSPARRAMYLNVSAGLGNSPYYPVRFACRPEATLLTLVGSDAR